MGADATIPPKGGLPFADPLQPAESGGGSIPPMQCPTHAKTVRRTKDLDKNGGT
jgi:hypothetical protein